MSALYLTAIVAAPDSASLGIVREGTGRHPGDRRGWRPIATSDSMLVAAQLRYGERMPVPQLRLQLSLPTLVPPSPLWVVFHISGNTVELMAPLAPGGSVRRRDLVGGVQVYACGERDLRGQLDLARALSLKRAYGIAC